jgi:peptidyl-prolyl cis-trans isomerase A (cyclophilin A)
MRRYLPLVALAAFVACKGDTKSSDAKSGAAAPAATPSSAERVKVLVEGDATLDKPAPDSFSVAMTTSAGDVDIVVRRAWSPRGADRFYWLSSHGFFDGARFFRVLPGFVAQFGLAGIPAVDKAWDNRAIADDPATQPNKRGTLVFAMGGPNTRTTQLFINLADNAQLDKMGFSPLGEVRRGMDVVAKFYGDYGDGAPYGPGPDQNDIKRDGNRFLTAAYPKLDSIVKVVVTPLGAAH